MKVLIILEGEFSFGLLQFRKGLALVESRRLALGLMVFDQNIHSDFLLVS